MTLGRISYDLVQVGGKSIAKVFDINDRLLFKIETDDAEQIADQLIAAVNWHYALCGTIEKRRAEKKAAGQ